MCFDKVPQKHLKAVKSTILSHLESNRGSSVKPTRQVSRSTVNAVMSSLSEVPDLSNYDQSES